ncbi:thioredoxin-related transmembrane protein 2 [Ipomoea triloba]|uniref:thioredoxin-related transmembrane protein 2 n=1 Tax=Ipomoea triloba TaxID=35885 RepID=UPI00125CE698|nr:thioredoxin-related transmembrane protein 2 [Ipomoea triloba]
MSSTSTARWLNRMASDQYCLLHILAFFSYIPIRCSTSHLLLPSRSSLLFKREIQAVIAFSVIAAVKTVRAETWQTVVSDSLFFAKIFLTALALVMDYHLALWYALVFIVIHILTQQPPYEGLGNSIQLTPLQLEALLTEGNTSRFWLVEFRALSTSTCICTSSFFPELSITYSNKNLSFGVVDLGLFPNAAEKFGISLASLNQLPVYILFENGTEVTRFPELDFQGTVFSSSITKKILCEHFELDKHLLDYINGK